ncbi:hypothetical protein F7U82_24545 [Vibrio parahaemolyticus]|uniref:hypothetical protein n=1 Tax=Vibrio parahaemolyticus TaxID=670 RepID=UPI0004286033|nr:hypothetical protein [Vibrio parahaemolyticus]EGQ9308595.1 hypothetical protein [Vibrio parahaemolyticus]EIY6179740.1 hypothetical protein [Vibrio parahaemolyticus]EJG1657815.1 hypothetical protein [Vibrio parahaemolyticus]EJG1678103.1 hypothetical protein [Vibrio parahaemolyticus]EJG1717517.1 hypothetical protein [Vibrio parahaemolyticus]
MKDPILVLIVKLSEAEEPIATPITLAVDGFLVSGIVVSADEYLSHTPLLSDIKRGFDEANDKAGGLEDDGERRFIHLKQAQYFTPDKNPIPSSKEMYTRINLEKVAAFSMGTLMVAD